SPGRIPPRRRAHRAAARAGPLPGRLHTPPPRRPDAQSAVPRGRDGRSGDGSRGMTNHAIARSFTLLADLLELEGEHIYNVRAYRKAAEAIDGLTENLESIATRGQLESIPGIGKAIAEKIEQLCATGEMRQLEEARRRTPEGLVEIMALPGFGQKKVQLLRQKLGITSLDKFEEAVRDGRVAATGGLGLRPGDDLLAIIAAYRRRSTRWPIGRALPYADSLARALWETGTCSRVEVAGSIHRMCDTAADLNLIAETGDASGARAAFLGVGEVGDLLDEEPGWVRARSQAGPRVTLALAGAADFGSQLWQATGSATHVEQLRRCAASRRVSLDAGFATEEELFAALGFPWIPPELREGRGEVEAAAAGRLPSLITTEAIRGILHAHSDWSDGSATIPEMAAKARGLGQQYLAMTDHSQRLGMAHGLDEGRVRAQMAEIEALNAAA